MTRKSIMLARAGFAAAAAGLMLAGCGGGGEKKPSEAEIFGYKGNDLLNDTNQTYIVVAPMVTNWVPERVLVIYEDYEFTKDELAVIEAAGTLVPSATHKGSLPEGYKCETKEPWFEVWNRPTESFGLRGVAGVMTHYNEDTGSFETSETYFSSYWNSREEALAALDKIEKQLADGFNVKKFHKFDGCWVAEYVRLYVMGVVGQKPDGTWTCMFDLRDKRNPGCGEWEPVRDQMERRNFHEYDKAMRAWRAETERLVAANREAVARACEARGLTTYSGASHPFDLQDGRRVYSAGGQLAPLKDGEDIAAVARSAWSSCAAEAEKALGVKFGETPEPYVDEMGARVSAEASNDLFKATLGVELFRPQQADPQQPAGENQQEPTEPEATPFAPNNWRISYEELMQNGVSLPPRPQLKRVED